MVCEPCAILAPHAFTPDNIGEAGTEHLALWKLFSSRREFMVLSGDGRLIYAGLGAKVSLGPFCRPFFLSILYYHFLFLEARVEK